MKLDLRPLLAGDKLLSFDCELSLDAEDKDLLSVFSNASFPSPMKVKGDITNTAGYMRLVAELSIDYDTLCSRCLAPLSRSFAFDLEKTVAPKNIVDDLPEEKRYEYAIIEDGFLDLDQEIKPELMLEFPSRDICSDDCKGLCQKCGKNLNEGSCDCKTAEIDPRLAPLQKILDQMKKEK